MGRAKKIDEEKKIKITVAIDKCNFEKLNEHKINKSKFINWLMLNYLINDKHNG